MYIETTNNHVGITSSGKTFSIGFCFLPGEQASDYAWALQRFQELGISPGVVVMDGDDALKNASEEVFIGVPTMLCTWHVNKCVLANCKKMLGDEDWPAFNSMWHSVIQAPTIDQFEERWLQFCTEYSNEKTQGCIDYLRREWIKDGQKERLVTAWTSHYLHFGTHTTSRLVLFSLCLSYGQSYGSCRDLTGIYHVRRIRNMSVNIKSLLK
jgi:hypothetical protein